VLTSQENIERTCYVPGLVQKAGKAETRGMVPFLVNVKGEVTKIQIHRPWRRKYRDNAEILQRRDKEGDRSSRALSHTRQESTACDRCIGC
jgi:hypothetical protein